MEEQTIVTHWMQTLKGDSAKVMLSGSFWALAGREGGDTIVTHWMQTLQGYSARV
jgi:hypothetical protein